MRGAFLDFRQFILNIAMAFFHLDKREFSSSRWPGELN